MRNELESKSPPNLAKEAKATEQPAKEADNDPVQPIPKTYQHTGGSVEGGLETEFGRLAIGEGRSRYVTSNFWASLNDEVRSPNSGK